MAKATEEDHYIQRIKVFRRAIKQEQAELISYTIPKTIKDAADSMVMLRWNAAIAAFSIVNLGLESRFITKGWINPTLIRGATRYGWVMAGLGSTFIVLSVKAFGHSVEKQSQAFHFTARLNDITKQYHKSKHTLSRCRRTLALVQEAEAKLGLQGVVLDDNAVDSLKGDCKTKALVLFDHYSEIGSKYPSKGTY